MSSTSRHAVSLILAALALQSPGCACEDPEAPDNNDAPSAVAGPDRNEPRDAAVTLDGSASTDPDGDSLRFSWRQTAGPSVALTDAESAVTGFTSPAELGALRFELTVSDGDESSTDDVTITIVEGNAPVVDAGPDRFVAPEQAVTLIGSGADPDGDALTFAWTQPSGTPVTLADADTSAASFVAPDELGTLSFTLTVSDGTFIVSDDVTVTVTDNAPPSADAGFDFSAAANSTAQLDGAASSDPEGAPLEFLWAQTSGPTVTLDNPALARPTFTTPATNGTLVFTLVVSDGSLTSAPDQVTVTVAGYGGERAGFDRHPFRLDSFIASIDPRALAAEGDFVYVADGTTGLGIYDVSDPDNPTLVGGDPTPIVDVDLSGGILSAVGALGELVVVDVSAPTAPELLSVSLGGRPLRFAATPTAGCTLLDTGEIIVSDLASAGRPVVGRIPPVSQTRNALFLQGARLYVGTSTGLEIFNLTSLASPALLGGLAVSGGIDALDVVGTTVYADGSSFVVIDAANAASPTVIGTTTGSDADALDVDQGLAVLSLGFDGIRVVDVSTPSAPIERSVYGTGFGMNARIVGTRAYVPTNDTMEIVDLSDPDNPSALGTYNDRLNTVEIVGDYAVGFQYMELFVINVADPTTPNLVLSVPFGSYSQGAAFDGTRLYTWDDEGTVFAFDVSTPTAPVALTSIRIPLRLSRVASAVDRAYAIYDQNAENRKGVQVYDLSDPSSPQVIANLPTYAAQEIAVSGAHAFVSSGQEGVTAIDFSDAALPVQLAESSTDGGHQMVARGDVLYSVTDELTIFDFRTASPTDRTDYFVRDSTALGLAPQHLFVSTDMSISGSVAAFELTDPYLISSDWRRSVPSQSSAVASNGALVFVASPGGVTLREFTADDTMDRLDTLQTNAGRGEVVGDRVYLLSYPAELSIHDASADELALLGSFPFGASAGFLAVDGDRAYVTTTAEEIVIVDVSDPAVPVELGRYEAAATILGLDASGDLLAVATATMGLELVDVSAPEAATFISRYGDFARSVELIGDHAYVDVGQLSILSLSNPAIPALVTTLPQHRFPVLHVGPQHVVIANFQDAAIFDVTDPGAPIRLGSYALTPYSGLLAATEDYFVVGLFDPGSSRQDVRVVDARDRFLPTLAAEVAVAGGVRLCLAHAEHVYIHDETSLAAYPPLLNGSTFDASFEAVSPSQVLSYSLHWSDRDASQSEEISCEVTGGTCSVTAFDQAGRTAAVTWTAPATDGEFEISVAVGNEHYFTVATDRVLVQ